MKKTQRYYGVAASHPVLKMLRGIGPFPSAAEAGAALDQLRTSHPAASLRIFDAPARFIEAALGDSMEDKIEHARYCLSVTLGRVDPYSVIEIFGGSAQPITKAYAIETAEKIGCPSDEIGTIEGQPLWAIVRRHLDTLDYAKAETKALWLRRGRGASGDEKLGEICVVTMPVYAPVNLTHKKSQLGRGDSVLRFIAGL